MTRSITYSPAYTIVPTYECFNRCTYCNFRTDPGQSPWLSLSEAEETLRSLRSLGIIEILVLSGEVHSNHPQRSAWFQRIFDLCELALSLGFLPHTNAGILSFEEMATLKTVNVSMGLMLEQVTPELLKTVHRHAPSKIPEVRSQQLEWAGELKIPFTTGLLLGLGETDRHRLDTLEVIAEKHDRWGHIQEVILQPYSPGQSEAWQAEPFDSQQLLQFIQTAREILPRSISIQIPPNLMPTDDRLIECLEAGATDLGGISPHDEVNPDYPHPNLTKLGKTLEEAGFEFVPRLPVYPQFESWLSIELRSKVNAVRQKN